MIKTGDWVGFKSAGGSRMDSPGETGINELGGSSLFFYAGVNGLFNLSDQSLDFRFHNSHLLVGDLRALPPIIAALGYVANSHLQAFRLELECLIFFPQGITARQQPRRELPGSTTIFIQGMMYLLNR